jgi:hypothetical protein
LKTKIDRIKTRQHNNQTTNDTSINNDNTTKSREAPEPKTPLITHQEYEEPKSTTFK